MKKFILGLIAAFCFSGCAVYADPVYNNCFEFQDEYGVRTVCNAQRQYIGNEWYYWDVNLGSWIGRNGYFNGGRYYRGYHPGYHGYYHRGYGGYHGGGYHGGSHGGRHGGHR